MTKGPRSANRANRFPKGTVQKRLPSSEIATMITLKRNPHRVFPLPLEYIVTFGNGGEGESIPKGHPSIAMHFNDDTDAAADARCV